MLKMNENLRFSWGHIIAFLALIAVSYVSFVGYTYLTDGNFTAGIIGFVLTDIFLILFFIGAQQMKAAERKFHRTILFERIFIFGSPLVLIAAMYGMAHFFTVASHNKKVVSDFSTAIKSSEALFTDYEAYCDRRIQAYDDSLGAVLANPESAANIIHNYDPTLAQVQRENLVETLRLQLRSQNYDSLRTAALDWIARADNSASTYNVFLLGNTRQIKNAVRDWENQLRSYSSRHMSNEWIVGEVPEFRSDGASRAIAGIDSLTSTFVTTAPPTAGAIIFGIVIYLMMIFPYLIQERHTKNTRRLLGRERPGKQPPYQASGAPAYPSDPSSYPGDSSSSSSHHTPSHHTPSQGDSPWGAF